MGRIFAFISLISLLSACREDDPVLTNDEVIAVIMTFDEGWQTKNARIVDSVLSEKYVYYTQSGNVFDRGSLVGTAGSDIYTLQTMERENLTVEIEGNTAVVNTVWKGKGIYHGEAFNDRQRCSITIVKHDGKVRILAEHCTPIK
jgi:hypothetical protein